MLKATSSGLSFLRQDFVRGPKLFGTSICLESFLTWSLRDRKLLNTIFWQNLEMRFYRYLSVRLSLCWRQPIPNMSTLCCLVQIKKRSHLTSCVFGFVFLNACSHLSLFSIFCNPKQVTKSKSQTWKSDLFTRRTATTVNVQPESRSPLMHWFTRPALPTTDCSCFGLGVLT